MKQVMVLFLLAAFTLSLAHTGEIVNSFKAPYSFSTGLTYDGKNLWVADYKADKLVAIDPESGEKLKEVPSPGFWPLGLAWDGKYLWNIDKLQDKIFQIDPEDGTILFTIDTPSKNAEGLTWDGKTLWVSDPRSDEIMKIDLSDGTAIHTFPAPATYAQGLAYDGTYLWCADRIRDEIYMIEPRDGEVIIITKSPGVYPRGLAWDGHHLWNVDYQTDQIYRLVRKDDQIFSVEDTRHSLVTFTHQVKIFGTGELKNLNVYMGIPENTDRQQVITQKFVPNDIKTVTDRWNQHFASFNYRNVQSEATIQSQMIVESRISDIDYYIFPDACGTLDEVPKEIQTEYTANGSKYMLDDPYIQKLAEEIVGNEKNSYWVARKIFNYVRNTLEYKLEGGWNVAPVVLKRGTGSCSEYSISFIALCRAAGLPARYVGSIVVRGDDASLDDVFHRWPEVYLPNYGWIPIDPQGGDKKLPRDRAMNIGHLSNRFLITTRGGGDSKYMGWYYNSYETYQTDPQIKVEIQTFGEWEPLENE